MPTDIAITIDMCVDGEAHAYRHADDGIADRPVCGAHVERPDDAILDDDSHVCERCHDGGVAWANAVNKMEFS